MTRQFDETSVGRLLSTSRRVASTMPAASVDISSRGRALVLEMPTPDGPARFAWPNDEAVSAARMASTAKRLLSRITNLPEALKGATQDENAGGPVSWSLRVGAEADRRILRLLASAAGPGRTITIVMPGPGWDASAESWRGPVQLDSVMARLVALLPSCAHLRCSIDQDGAPLFRISPVTESICGSTDIALAMRDYAAVEHLLR